MSIENRPFLGQPNSSFEGLTPGVDAGKEPVEPGLVAQIEVYLDSGTVYYQSKNLVNVYGEFEWERKVLDVSDLSKHGNLGDGWQIGNFSFILDDADGALRSSSEIWHNKKVIVHLMEEVNVNGVDDWQLIERERWTGVVEGKDSSQYGQLIIKCSEAFGNLGLISPSQTINSADFPAALEGALGNRIPILTGEYTLGTGAVVGYNIGNGQFLFCKNDVVTFTGFFIDGVSISNSYWGKLRVGDYTVIKYSPPEDSELPSKETSTAFANLIATDYDNPVDCLKDIIDDACGDDVFFTGADSVKTEFDTRGYKAAINSSMGDEVGEIVTEFCNNFDCFATINDDNLLQLGIVSTTPVATFTYARYGSSEAELPQDMANSVTMSYGYDFANNKFTYSDIFDHNESIEDYGKKPRDKDFFFVRDKSTAYDVTRRYVRQQRQIPRELDLVLMFEEQRDLSIGDLITLTDDILIYSGAHTYLIKGKTYSINENTVTLHCVRYYTDMDYIVTISQNSADGGTVTPSGIQVLSAGDNLTITGVAATNWSLSFIWVDYTTKVTGTGTYNITSIAADIDIFYSFVTDKYIITAMDDGNGTIDPKGAVLVAAGGNQSFTYTPNAGKTFSKWVVDGVDSTTYPYVFSSVSADHEIIGYSTDTYIQYVSLVINKSGAGTVQPYNGGTFSIQYNNEVWLIFSPDATALTVNGVDRLSGNASGIYLGRLTVDTTVNVTF